MNMHTTTDTQLAPTDAEIAALAVEINKTDWNDAMDALICFARAVLDKWGQPAHSGEPVAWRYRMSGDMQWQYTERKEQFSHASEVEALTNMQPAEREPLTHAQAKALVSKYGNDPLHLVLQVERAHGITQKGGQHVGKVD